MRTLLSNLESVARNASPVPVYIWSMFKDVVWGLSIVFDLQYYGEDPIFRLLDERLFGVAIAAIGAVGIACLGHKPVMLILSFVNLAILFLVSLGYALQGDAAWARLGVDALFILWLISRISYDRMVGRTYTGPHTGFKT